MCRYIRGISRIRAASQPARRKSLFSMLVSPFVSKHVARVAMFGQGLETSTSGIVRELMWGPSTPFRVTGLLPGQQGKGRKTQYNSSKEEERHLTLVCLALRNETYVDFALFSFSYFRLRIRCAATSADWPRNQSYHHLRANKRGPSTRSRRKRINSLASA